MLKIIKAIAKLIKGDLMVYTHTIRWEVDCENGLEKGLVTVLTDTIMPAAELGALICDKIESEFGFAVTRLRYSRVRMREIATC